jgi:hypothetical protein
MSELKLDRLARIEDKQDAILRRLDTLLDALGEPESEPLVDLEDTTTTSERDQNEPL